MAAAESSEPKDLERPKKPPMSGKLRNRVKSWLGWEHNPPQAIVYNLEGPHLTFEDINEVNKESNAFEIQLPRWRNRVHVYADMEEQRGFAATLWLDRLGMKKNWQRRLGMNYQVLHVKGKKPVWPI